jgi:hypothetical protein
MNARFIFHTLIIGIYLLSMQQQLCMHTSIIYHTSNSPLKKQYIANLKKEYFKKDLSSDHMNTIIKQLAQKNVPWIAHNQAYLHQSIDLFYKTPGFLSLLKRMVIYAVVDNDQSCKGIFYELQKAREIANAKTSETVVAFNRIFTGCNPAITREIDIVTTHRWIECKNMNRIKCDRLQELKQQFLQQKQLADDYNKKAEKPITYEVHFKSLNNPALSNWFKEHNIDYEC